ncbi:cation diffusion facilitator family transporter [Hymenobacter sp. 5317J-9]|uniref:cation diffusion facilitator family transporter n=1 Tax=Hymenobacter sp. 5317J-9 TaxID=2932250 RepID=UPI001FD71645|nr:cation diffusion facilitator family transporter [Hymenobacter sp. 5317J-9]UOQ98760.1 cation diffusion facilitator family transporter [Hymenobacter sp. 5317J-9]
MADANASKLSLYGGIAANVAIAISKFVAAYFTGSSAMLSEGIHSLVDTGNSGLLLYGTAQSQRPPDAEHPFGHSKELYFWGLIVAVLIFAIGGGMSFYEGIKHIQHPEPLEDAGWNYVVLGLSFLFEGIAFYLSVKALLAQSDANVGFVKMLRTSRDPAVFASVMENLAALIGLALAGIGVFLGHWLNNPYFDGGASIAIGLLLMLVAVFLVGRTKGLLVGTGVDAPTLANLERIARDQPQVREIRSPLTMYLGPNDVIMALDVDFADNMSSTQVAAAVEELQDAIRREHPEVQRIFIEAKNLVQTVAGK